ncbi:helix-turn-helix transcriptional regulator [Candidatus Poseidonia alphae]|nr:helix-turn-helix transcriptional regulator [Candidatus Poseidonia alphae]MDA8530376.1 helix-turn-helix transcriptional regulator [Candidatus Poseidonia alphae]MDA8748629.1 helix-turn-helix transcriptional regulator [Candidatus Poseidonia alphae]MDB2335860.1 helix-turn-helix transcriptional regulator [Candidatus Poseidonia alphae]MDB2569188.1 helix-turn-helix transcriptional regulator [Candidatus Poseidonia alphae]
MDDAESAELDALRRNLRNDVDHLIRLLSKSTMLHTLVVLNSDKEPMRFSEIQRRVESTATTLSRRLAELEEYGLITRKEFTDSQVNRVEYALTDDGVALHPSLESVFEWVLHRSADPRIQSLETPCSTQVTTGSGGEV